MKYFPSLIEALCFVYGESLPFLNYSGASAQARRRATIFPSLCAARVRR